MPGTTLNISSQTTGTGFRTWGSAISNALATVGMVKTADTGQIDWATVANPGTNGVEYGYEIWRLNDALQATNPLFFRLGYGAGSGSGTPQLYVSAGTATDGAGVLGSAAGTGTSTTTTRVFAVTNVTLPAVIGNVYVSAPDSSCLGVLAWPGYHSAWGGGSFFIERTRNPDGTPNGDGYLLGTSRSTTTSSAVTNFEQRYYSTTLANPSQTNSAFSPGIADASLQSVAMGTTLYPRPVFTGFTPRLGGPSRLLVSIGKGDVPANNTFTMTHYGASRTWVSAGGGTTNNDGWGGWTYGGSYGSGLNSFAMRMD